MDEGPPKVASDIDDMEREGGRHGFDDGFSTVSASMSTTLDDMSTTLGDMSTTLGDMSKTFCDMSTTRGIAPPPVGYGRSKVASDVDDMERKVRRHGFRVQKSPAMSTTWKERVGDMRSGLPKDASDVDDMEKEGWRHG